MERGGQSPLNFEHTSAQADRGARPVHNGDKGEGTRRSVLFESATAAADHWRGVRRER